jgi:hypothetical protein
LTDLSVKNRIVALSSFVLLSVVLTIRNVNLFTFILFGFLGLVIFFADKILDNQKIQERTLSALFTFAVCYQTFLQLFNLTYDNFRQLLVSAAFAIFLAAVFVATDRKKFPYAVVSAPLICLLDVRTASAYCTLLLSLSIVLFISESRNKKSGKKSSKKKAKKQDGKVEPEPITVILISIFLSIAGLVFCVYSALKNGIPVIENITFFFSQYKNTLGCIILIAYLFIKLIKSNLRATVHIVAGLFIHIAAMIFFTVIYGWTLLSLFLLSAIMFLGIVCLESEETVNEIKSDCHNHRYLFLVGMLCLLQ